MKLRLLFIQFPIALTLNNAFASLGGDYYLGTINWKFLKIRWNIFKKACSVFQIKKEEKEQVFMTSSHSCENQRSIFNLALIRNYVNWFSQ
jgi:hypothetical protein